MEVRRLLYLLLAAFPVLYAASGIDAMAQAMNNLCVSLSQLLPVAAMLMTILAGVIYASGQMMGAETRARANVWATACIVGAMMAVLIVVLAPSILGSVYGGTISCSATSGSGGTPLPSIGVGVRCTNPAGCICPASSSSYTGCTDVTCANGEECQDCPGNNLAMECW